MTTSKAWIVAVMIVFLIIDHSPAAWIALAVLVVSMSAGLWYARRSRRA